MTNKLLAVAFAAFALAASGCGSSSSSSSSTPPSSTGTALTCTPASLQTLTSGTLTIGTDNPAYSPYFTGGPGHDWTGQYNNDPYTDKGFEDAVAYAVAEQARLSQATKVTWAVTHFDQVVRARPQELRLLPGAGLDPAPSAPRAPTSALPYYDVNQAVVALKGNPITNGHVAGRPEAVQARHPDRHHQLRLHHQHDPAQTSSRGYNTTNDAIHALKAGQIDGIVVDLPTAYYMTSVQIANGTVVGQFPPSPRRRPLRPGADKGSPLTPCVNKAAGGADGATARSRS